MMGRFGLVGTAGLLVAALFCASASAGTILDNVSDSAYRSLGQEERYQSVGQVSLLATDGYNYLGSGVLIDSKWVLTAGHIVYDAVSLDFHIGGQTYAASRMIAYPSYNGSDLSYDIGLVELGGPVTGVAAAVRYTGKNELGAAGTFVGYGTTGDGQTGGTTFDGQKRAGQNSIDVAFVDTGGRKNWRVFGVDFDSPDGDASLWGSSDPLALEYLINFGDSGGGVFLDEGGQTYLAGIHSFIVDQNVDGLWGDYGDYTGHVRVSAFNGWIDSIVGGSADGGKGGGNGKGGGPGRGKNGLSGEAFLAPEPASVALLGLGSLLMVFCRRRRGPAGASAP